MVAVSLDDIPDFPGQPGQRPRVGDPATVSPVEVVLVAAPLDREYRNVALNAAAVDTFIAADHFTVTFIDDGRYLHAGRRAAPRVA